MRRLTLSHLAPLLLLGTTACRTPSSHIPIETLRGDDSTDEAAGEARPAVDPLPVERPTDLLPAEVPVFAEALDPAAVLAMFAPLDAYPDVARVRAEAASMLGGDLLDPNQWATLGLDSRRPAGVGMLDLSAQGMFAYVSLTDASKFEATLMRFADAVGAREELSAMEVGFGRVYRFGNELHIVVREGVAVLLFVDRPDEAPRDYVVSVATMDPRDSLGRSDKLGWARAQLLGEDDGMIYVDPGSLLAQIQREDLESSDYGVRYAEEELARARAAGESADYIRELEARVDEERRWQREREQRDKGARELANQLIGSIETVVAAADLQDDGIVGHARVKMSGTNLLRRMFVAPERESPLLTALDDAPVFVADGRVDVQVVLELVELFARAEGESLASVNAELTRELGIDVIGGLVPAFTGEGGFAITQTGKPDPKKLAEVPKSLGLAGHLGLRDPEPVRRLFDALARDKRAGGALTRGKRADTWTLDVPEWRKVELSIVGDRLIASTDAKFPKRVRDAERGSFAAGLSSAHPLQGPNPNPVQRLYGRWVGLLLAETHEPWTQDPAAFLYDLDNHAVLSPEEAAKVPHSKDYKRKRAELDRAVAALDRYNRERAQTRFEAGLKFAESLGDAGIQLELVADGLAFTGQWRFAPGTTPVGLGYQAFAFDSGQDWAEYDRLNADIYMLADELRAIRMSDLDAAANKRQ